MTYSQVQVSTSQYEFAHGRKPRGEGGWFFFAGGEDFFFHGMFTTARHEAQMWAAERCFGRVEVGS